VDLGLQGKVALVTAASRGIGRAVAERLSAEGATVVVSARDADALNAAAAANPGMSAMPVDLSDPVATGALVGDVIAAHGRLDVLVCNTAGPRIVPFLETSPEDWAAAYDLLVRPAVQLAGDAARHMVERGDGSIVFITSTWVRQPKAGGVLSASMRSAVSAMGKQMAIELAPHGVRVNQVMPGATATDRMKNIVAGAVARNGTTPDQERAKIIQDIPLGRWAEAEEIADAVAFFASQRSSFVTGSALAVDGGAVRGTL
jgi:3-oxoacyl-[acyl-carrier protein] reductase